MRNMRDRSRLKNRKRSGDAVKNTDAGIRTQEGWRIPFLPLCVRLALVLLLVFAASGCGKQMSRYELRELGIEAMRAGDYEGAMQRFAEALDASRGQVSELQYDILKYRAECEVRLKKYAEAKSTYEALQQLDEKEENQKKYQEVLSELSGMDQLQEAVSVMEAGDYEAAFAVFDPMADLNGGMVGRTAWFNRAVCLEYQQRYSEAEEAFAAYLEVYPEDEEAGKELDFLRTR